MKALNHTPKTNMQLRALYKRAEPLAKELAPILKTTETEVVEEFSQWFYYSTRLEFEAEDRAWSPALGSDDDETLKAKFLAYCDTDLNEIGKAVALINAHDAPANPETAPTPPKDDERGK